jgi:hypothetical protein
MPTQQAQWRPGNSALRHPQRKAAAAQPVAPATGSVSLSWQGPAQVKVGEQFSVVLRVNSQQALRGLPLLVGFDPQLMQAVNAQEGDFFRQAGGKSTFSQRVDGVQGQGVHRGIAREPGRRRTRHQWHRQCGNTHFQGSQAQCQCEAATAIGDTGASIVITDCRSDRKGAQNCPVNRSRGKRLRLARAGSPSLNCS